jgi:transcriptional regulator with XRE-family HTH domain
VSIDPIGEMLKVARKATGLSHKELAGRAEVSTRLVAEFERGQRTNVSLATALRVLAEVGVVIQLTDAAGGKVELGDPRRAAAVRANLRRTTWTGNRLTCSLPAAS